MWVFHLGYGGEVGVVNASPAFDVAVIVERMFLRVHLFFFFFPFLLCNCFFFYFTLSLFGDLHGGWFIINAFQEIMCTGGL